MNKIYVLLCVLLLSAASFAQRYEGYNRRDDDNIVRWRSIVGVITAQGVLNPISANITSGTFGWSTRSGRARVNLETGALSFDVQGLVINGTPFSGTAGPIRSVTGTLVCDAGTDQEATFDSQPVSLSQSGNARFSGRISVPGTCGNPLFLIRIANLPGANGRWIATGTEPSFGNRFEDDDDR